MADDLLKFDIDSFLLWINAVRRPFVTIAELLSDEDERRSLTAVFQLWIVSAILSTAVASVIVQFILKTPVELKDTLYYFASGMLFFLLTVLVLHLSLRLTGIPSNFSTTAAIQSVMNCYSPILTVFLVPLLLRNSSGSLTRILDFRVMPEEYSAYQVFMSRVLSVDYFYGLRFLSWCGPLLSAIVLALSAEAVSRFYDAAKLRAQSAIVISALLCWAIPVVLMLALR